MALFVTGALVSGTVYGSGAGTQQNTGQAIAIRGRQSAHNEESLVGCGRQPATCGGTQPNVNASITIEKLD